jgi:hypothetical protein
MGNQITPQRGKINTQSTFCPHAYIITLKGAIKLLNFLLNWNYKNFDHYNRGKTLNGLYVFDIMNNTLQRKINNRQIPRIFTWYCWDGTYHPCDRNRLPLKGNDIRNSGLVFQNTDTLKTTVGISDIEIIFKNKDDIKLKYFNNNEIIKIIFVEYADFSRTKITEDFIKIMNTKTPDEEGFIIIENSEIKSFSYVDNISEVVVRYIYI